MLYSPTVSYEFRRLLGDHLPGLGHNPTYWRLTHYLLFGTRCDADSGKLLLSAQTCASLEDSQAQLDARNYVAETLLTRYNRDVLRPSKQDLIWSDWSYMNERCRVVQSLQWSEEVRQAVAAERRREWAASGRVYVADGTAWSRAKQAAQTDARRKAARQQISCAQCADAHDLLEYTSNQPSNTYTHLLRNYDMVYRMAEQYDAQRRPKNPDHPGRQQADVLNAVRDHPQPFYSASEHTVRVFGIGETYLSLKKHLREALCHDWIDLDLQSSQLAIVARQWHLSDVQALLDTGVSVWQWLLTAMVISPDNTDAKGAVKKAVYSLVYGMGRRNVVSSLDAALGDGFGERFFGISLVDSIYQAREEQQARVWEAGGMRDCYGRWLPATSRAKGHSTPRSVLAQAMQASEMQLLAPIIHAAREQTGNRGFRLTAWQHDGVSITARRESENEKWVKNLQASVGHRAEQFGYATSLEVARPVA